MNAFRTIFCIIIIVLTIFSLNAQQTNISDLKTPPSPAFVLLGIEPTSISSPSTPRAVAGSFVSTIQQGGAMEIAPYWLTAHPNLTFDEYYKANVGQTILQTLSISFATIPKTSDTDTMGTRVGLGARWLLVSGEPRDSLYILKDGLKKLQGELLETEDSVKQKEIKSKMKAVSLAIQKMDHRRVGFSLAMASAATMNFLHNNPREGKLDKWGVWLTASYLMDEPSIDFLAVARVITNSKEEGSQNIFDLGARIVASISNFSLSCEYIQRAELSLEHTAQTGSIKSGNFFLKNTYRLAGNLEYKYSSDISVFMTFGKNYSTENEQNGSLVAQVGFNFGLGEIPIIKDN